MTYKAYWESVDYFNLKIPINSDIMAKCMYEFGKKKKYMIR